MKANLNEMPRNSISPEQLNAMFDRTNDQALADREARERAAEWPSLIERLIARLGRRASAQEEALTAIGDRLSALEAAMGIGRA